MYILYVPIINLSAPTGDGLCVTCRAASVLQKFSLTEVLLYIILLEASMNRSFFTREIKAVEIKSAAMFGLWNTNENN